MRANRGANRGAVTPALGWLYIACVCRGCAGHPGDLGHGLLARGRCTYSDVVREGGDERRTGEGERCAEH